MLRYLRFQDSVFEEARVGALAGGVTMKCPGLRIQRLEVHRLCTGEELFLLVTRLTSEKALKACERIGSSKTNWEVGRPQQRHFFRQFLRLMGRFARIQAAAGACATVETLVLSWRSQVCAQVIGGDRLVVCTVPFTSVYHDLM